MPCGAPGSQLTAEAMRYTRNQAKDYAHQHLKGIWAAAPTVFTADLALDLPAFARNIQHWIVDLEIDGVFVGGKQGEYFSMLLSERKQLFDIAVATAETLGRPAGVMLSCSDQNLDATLDLAMHAQAVGAEYIVIHSPALPFGKDIDSTVHEYYRYISERLDIAIAMWNHPDCGYVMSPQLCARIAGQCPNIVAIKYSVARDLYVELTRLTAGTLIVSSASEEEWLDNVVELGWQVYLCSVPPILYQTPTDRRMQQYTRLAMRGDVRAARAVRDSLEPVRRALRNSRPPGTPHAQQKYWQELLGQAGGPVRRPLLNLTATERAVIRRAFFESGLTANPEVGTNT